MYSYIRYIMASERRNIRSSKTKQILQKNSSNRISIVLCRYVVSILTRLAEAAVLLLFISFKLLDADALEARVGGARAAGDRELAARAR